MFFIHHSSLFDLFCFLFIFFLFFNLDDYIISANIFSRVRRVVLIFLSQNYLKVGHWLDQILIFCSQNYLKVGRWLTSECIWLDAIVYFGMYINGETIVVAVYTFFFHSFFLCDNISLLIKFYSIIIDTMV